MTRKCLFLFVFFLLSTLMDRQLHAQILQAKIGVNGLTCSQCSRSVEMQLRKLSFVKDVNMNLEHTEGTLQFKEGAKVDFSKIARAVKDAGFTLRFLNADIDLSAAELNTNGFKLANNYFLVANKDNNTASKATFRFLGKMYSAEKDKYSDHKTSASAGNIYHVEMIK